MRRLPVLKTLTNILFYLCVVVMVFIIPMCIMGMIMPERIPFTIHDISVKDMHTEEWILFFGEIIAAGFWVYALYLFKLLLALFEKKKIFHEDAIRLLDQTGRAIIKGLIIFLAIRFLYSVVASSGIEIGIDSLHLFILILGFFFMVLSEVFLIAKNMKEDNDLTI